MGCFLACFGGEKGRKRGRKSLPIDRNRAKESYQALRTSPSPKKVAAAAKEVVAPSDDPAPELRVKNQEQEKESSGGGGGRKKVTFDLNVKTYEDPVLIHEETQCQEEEKKAEEESKGGRAAASPVAFPTNHRYGNCAGSDDEEDVVDDSDEDDYGVDEEGEEDYNFDDDEEDEGVVATEEESYDSFFSLPLENEKQRSCQEVSSSPLPITGPDRAIARDRSKYVHPVLNPVQNLSQWKEAKVRGLPPKDPNKLNIELAAKNPGKENVVSDSESIPFCPEPAFKVNNKARQVSDTKQEISVDASLSTWLVSPQSSTKVGRRPQESGGGSHRSNSSVNREDRPILGALTVEDIKQSSVTSSPRRSPSKSPEDMPILGSVGSYWSSEEARSDTKGIPNTTSKYREDKRVNWHSTPFEVRLEKALNEGAAEAYQV